MMRRSVTVWRNPAPGFVQRAAAAALGLAAVFPAAAPAQPAPAEPSAPPPVRVKVVPQSTERGLGMAWAWSQDDRYVLAASSVDVRLWNVATGALVNAIRLPAVDGVINLLPIGVELDTAAARGVVMARGMSTGSGEDNPGGPKAGSRRFVRFDVDLRTDAVAAAIVAPPGAAVRYEDHPPAHGTKLWLDEDPRGAVYVSRSCCFEGGEKVASLNNGPRETLVATAVSPDGRHLALIKQPPDADDYATGTRIDIVGLEDGSLRSLFGPRGQFAHGYEGLAWIDPARLLVSSRPQAITALVPSMAAINADWPEPPALVVRLDEALTIEQRVPARCHIVVLPGGTLIGAALPHCTPARGSGGLEIKAPGQPWRPLGGRLLEGRLIEGLAASPDGRTLAVTSVPRSAEHRSESEEAVPLDRRIAVVDLRTRTLTADIVPPGAFNFLGASFFSATGLVIADDTGRYVWEAGTAGLRQLDRPGAGVPSLLGVTLHVRDGVVYEVNALHPMGIRRLGLDGRALPLLPAAHPVSFGLVPGKPLAWTAARDGALTFWDLRRDRPLFTRYQSPGQKVLVADPAGRFDTNARPDGRDFRWLVTDRPLESLSPQTFMREYFEPGLMQRLLSCTFASDDPGRDGCKGEFAAVRDIATLNRTLPEAPQVTVEPGDRPDMARVSVSAAPTSRDGRSSGLYDLRVLLDGRLVASDPPPGRRGRWRDTARLNTGPDGRYHATFTIALPSTATDRHAVSAYLFNDDRVKSDDGAANLRSVQAPDVPARAYVVAIGIDNYSEPRFRLAHAADDARLMRDTLKALPGYETRGVLLASDPARPVPRAAIEATFRLLGGQDPERARKDLADLGIDASQLAPVTPNDLVFITWAGHGTFYQSRFYLAPSDVSWPEGTVPDTRTLVSGEDLSQWLMPLQAREITLVIDACNSANSVAPGFKPAPMGDRGLGQLAFDKGIRVLAATQGDSVARESAALGHGLLTHALAAGARGPADRNGDRSVMLEEWLAYAVRTVPLLGREPGRRGRPGAVAAGPGHGSAAIQRPVVYDYNPSPSFVVVGGARP